MGESKYKGGDKRNFFYPGSEKRFEVFKQAWGIMCGKQNVNQRNFRERPL